MEMIQHKEQQKSPLTWAGPALTPREHLSIWSLKGRRLIQFASADLTPDDAYYFLLLQGLE